MANPVLDRAVLQELARWWAELNDAHFSGAMRPPVLSLSDGRRCLGAWVREGRCLSLSRALVENYPWGQVIEVLRHEMAHQYVHEVLGVLDETAHGPAFRRVCAEHAIDSSAAGIVSDSALGSVREPDRFVRKIQALFALAASDNRYEAQAATNAAHRLMRRYNIEVAETLGGQYAFCHLGETSRRIPAHLRILAGVLGEHFFVQPIWVPSWDRDKQVRGRILEICGRPTNLEIAAHVHKFVCSTAERLWSDHKREQGLAGNRERRRYLAGVMLGFHEQLVEQARQCTAAGLVWVGDGGLDLWVYERHPRLLSGRAATVRKSQAWVAGRAAGTRIVVHKALRTQTRNRARRLGGPAPSPGG